ncbi:MAG: 50S ribosomal protein L11 methyltransferase [Proteobacteria bacterium]|nr:50S ribosomal protein L11 methyltransferase [Pseudomonadota bacterium]
MKPRVEWAEICLDIPQYLEDPIAGFIFDLGSHGVFTDRAKSRPYFDLFSGPKPERLVLLAYFIRDENLEKRVEQIREFIRSAAQAQGREEIPKVSYEILMDEDWAENWKCLFQVVRIGKQIVIKPSWESVTPAPGEVVVEITAGMAFGTGTHFSTRLALILLEETLEEMKKKGPVSVLDVGTGSGILGIVAVKLGVEKVVGIDLDPRAVEIARNNAYLNQVTARMETSETPVAQVPGEFEIVVANILAEDLIEMKKELVGHMKKSGYLILSGVLTAKRDQVREAFEAEGVVLDRDPTEDEWIGMRFKKR